MVALNFPTNPSDGDIYGDYTFDGTRGVWVVIPTAKPTTVSQLTDVDIDPAVANNYALLYNATSENWESSAIPASAITSGTFDIGRIPTGTTSSTVSLGNHTHTAGDLPNLESLNGTLDIANGGTGATTLVQAQGNLRIGLVPVIPTQATYVSGTGSIGALGKVTFSNCTKLELRGVFSSEYDNYRFVLRTLASANGLGMRARLSASGTEYSANTHHTNGASQAGGAGAALYYSGGDTAFAIGEASSATNTGDITTPFLSGWNTQFNFINHAITATPNHAWITGVSHTDSTSSYDGINFYPTTGTFSGTVQIFGYND